MTAHTDSLVPALAVHLTGRARMDTSSVGGTLQVGGLSPGVYLLRTTSIGHFPRSDTLRMHQNAGIALLVPLDQMWSDWCGMGDVVVPRPWWKFW